MKSEKLEVVRGSGNDSRSGDENANAEQFKAILAAEIIKALIGTPDCARRRTVHRNSGGRFLAHPQ